MRPIDGPGFSNYDAQHLQIVRRQTPESVKPNLFKDIDQNVAQALILSDVVDLSPEAKALLKKLRRQLSGEKVADEGRTESFQDLVYTLGQLRDLVYAAEQEEKKQQREQKAEGKKHGAQPPMLQLSGPAPRAPQPQAQRKKGGPMREIVGRMTVHTPSPTLLEALKDEMEVLGEKMLETVSRFGVKIIVLERNVPLTGLRLANMAVVAPGERTFDGRDWAGVRGLYDQSRRLMVIGEEKLGQPNQSAARHEFAHAFDHAFSDRNKRHHHLSTQLWNLFAERRKGLVTPYAGTNPAEYFAESVETFFKPRGRELVLEKDPQMYQYLEALFTA